MMSSAVDGQQVSSLPLPPLQYVNLFGDVDPSSSSFRRPAVRTPPPPPLPPAPIHDTYTMFGQTYCTDDLIIRPLETQGFKRLYPQNFDHKRELKKLNHSILVNFLDLLDIFIRAPDSSKREEKIEDLNLLFIHIHHLINEFRPHQARETLRVMMELQKQQRLETAERFQKHLDRVLEKLHASLAAGTTNDVGSSDWDCKLLVPTESIQPRSLSLNEQLKVNKVAASEIIDSGCSGHDKLMCDIIDAI